MKRICNCKNQHNEKDAQGRTSFLNWGGDQLTVWAIVLFHIHTKIIRVAPQLTNQLTSVLIPEH